jgi:hypothetical protein
VSHDRSDVADLCPAISSGRSWVGMFAERSVSTPPAACCATPLERPLFALAAPEGVYLSAIGMLISLPLLRAACPRQNAEKC